MREWVVMRMRVRDGRPMHALRRRCGQDGQAWVNRGNVVRYNTFTHIRMTEKTTLGSPSVQAVYLDDQMSGWVVANNTFVDCQTGILLGGGRQSTLQGNYFQDVDTAVHFDNRGMGWQKSSCGVGEADYKAAQAVLPWPAWRKYNITLDVPCVPVENTVSDNRCVHTCGCRC